MAQLPPLIQCVVMSLSPPVELDLVWEGAAQLLP